MPCPWPQGHSKGEILALVHGQFISFHLPLEHPSSRRAGAQHKGISFRVGRRFHQWDGCWMPTLQLRPEHSQECSSMPPWTHRLREKRQLSWKKTSGCPFTVLFSCGLDGIRVSLLPSPCWNQDDCVLGRVSADSSVFIPVCEHVGSNRRWSLPSPAWDWSTLEYCREK